MFLSVSSFAVPASLVLIISLAIVVARRRNDVTSGKPHHAAAVDYSRFGPCTELHDYDVIEDTGSAPDHHVTTGIGEKLRLSQCRLQLAAWRAPWID